MASVGTLSVELQAKVARFQRDMGLAQGSINRFGGAARTMGQQARGMAGNLAGVAVGVLGVAAAFRGLKKSVEIFAEFEASMVRVRGLVAGASDDIDADFQRLTETAKTLGATTEFTAAQAAEGMQFLAMAGQNASQIIDSLPASMQLASAASVELAQAADIVTNVMSTFGLTVSELNATNDTLVNTFTRSNQSLTDLGDGIKKAGPIARNLGLTVSDVSAALAVLADKGIRGGEAGRGLRRVMAGLAKPTTDAKKAFKVLGISIDDLTENNFEGFVQKLKKAKGEIGGVKFAAETLRAFDVFGGPIAQSLAEGEETLERVRKAHENAGVAAKLQGDFLETTAGKFKLTESAISGMATALGEALGPAVRSSLKAVEDLANEWRLIIEVMAGIGDPLGEKLLAKMNKLGTTTQAFSGHLIKAKADLAAIKAAGLGEAVGAELARANVLIAKSGGDFVEALDKAITRVDKLKGKLKGLSATAGDLTGTAPGTAPKDKPGEGGGGGGGGLGLSEDEIAAAEKLAERLARINQKFAAQRERIARDSADAQRKIAETLAADLENISNRLAASTQGAAPGIEIKLNIEDLEELDDILKDSREQGIKVGGLLQNPTALGSKVGSALGQRAGDLLGGVAGGIGASIGSSAGGAIVSALLDAAVQFAEAVQSAIGTLAEPLRKSSGRAGELATGLVGQIGAGLTVGFAAMFPALLNILFLPFMALGAIVTTVAVGFGALTLLASGSEAAKRFGEVMGEAVTILEESAGGLFVQLMPFAQAFLNFAVILGPVIEKLVGIPGVVDLLIAALAGAGIGFILALTPLVQAIGAARSMMEFFTIGIAQVNLFIQELVGNQERLAEATASLVAAENAQANAVAESAELVETMNEALEGLGDLGGESEVNNAIDDVVDSFHDLMPPLAGVGEGLEKMTEAMFNVPRVLSVIRARLAAADPMGGASGGGGATQGGVATGSLLTVIIENFNSNADSAEDLRAELEREARRAKSAKTGNPFSEQLEGRGFG